MYINKTITTKARPIKKVCIIDKDDYANLIKIIKMYSSEIGGFLNLIFVNDAELFSENSIEFIKYHDPDIILNFSSCENETLTLNFNTYTIDGKRKDFNQHDLSIHLTALTQIPGFPQKEFERSVKNIYTRLDKESNIKNLIYYVNFGLLDPDFGNYTEHSFFENINFINLDSNDNFFEILFDTYKENLAFVNGILSLCTESVDIWHVNHNKKSYYNKEPTVIFGSNKNIKSIVYFWNMRATYTHNTNVWLPLELFDKYKDHLTKFTNFCIFQEKDYKDFKAKIKEVNNKISEIDNTKYFFDSERYDWELFQHAQNVSVINKRLTLIHPPDKLFSSYFNLNIVLEVRGLNELYLPKSFKLGRLFKSPRTFSRISPSKLMYDFSSVEARAPYIDELNIPDSKAIFEAIFEEHGLKLKNTPKSQLTDQLINNLGGYEELNIVSDKDIYDLLVKLTPKRIQRIIEEVTKDLNEYAGISEDQIKEIFEKKIDHINTLSSNIIVEADNLRNMLPKVYNKKKFYSSVQRLYEMNILLRGKSFNCPLCNSKLWYPLSSIPDKVKCYCCNNFINIPIYIGSKPLNDSFRLNELMVNSVDQGVLPVLLTTNFLFKQQYSGKRFIFDYEVSENSEPLAEIDIIFTLGARIGIAEVKANSGFKNDQVDRLLNIGRKINADIILFSTIKRADSEEVKELFKYIKEKNLNIPAFILTEEVLFAKELVNLNKFFIVNYENTFQKGPIIVADYISSIEI